MTRKVKAAFERAPRRPEEVKEMRQTICGTDRKTTEDLDLQSAKSPARIREDTRRLLRSAKSTRAAAFRKTREEITDTLAAVRTRVAEVLAETRDFMSTCRETRSPTAQRDGRAKPAPGAMDKRAAGEPAQAVPPHESGLLGLIQRDGRAKPAPEQAAKVWMSNEERILEIILEHPEGISATEIGKRIGMTPFDAGSVATQLAATRKVRKDRETRKYYPTDGRA